MNAMLALLFAALAHSPAQAATPAATASTPASPALTADVLTRYDAVRGALVSDKLPDLVLAARALAAAAPDDGVLAASATSLGAAPDLATARVAFGELSRLLVLRAASTTPPLKVIAYYCPMFDGGFAWWLQPKAGIANPYMGQSMPTCGEELSLKAAQKAALLTASSP